MFVALKGGYSVHIGAMYGVKYGVKLDLIDKLTAALRSNNNEPEGIEMSSISSTLKKDLFREGDPAEIDKGKRTLTGSNSTRPSREDPVPGSSEEEEKQLKAWQRSSISSLTSVVEEEEITEKEMRVIFRPEGN